MLKTTIPFETSLLFNKYLFYRDVTYVFNFNTTSFKFSVIVSVFYNINGLKIPLRILLEASIYPGLDSCLYFQ